jgi:hypothetical protein
MALLLAEGFDIYKDTDDCVAGTGLYRQMSACVWHATDGRYSGGCIKGAHKDEGWWWSRQLNGGDTLVFCFAYWHDGGGSGDMTMFYGISPLAGATCVRITVNPSGDLKFFGGDGGIGSTVSGAIPSNTWVWVEIKVKASNGLNGELTVRINGSTVQTITGVRLHYFFDNDGISTWRWSGPNGNWKLDDLIIMDTSGSTMNDFLGDTRIDTLIPSASGSQNDFTASSGAQIDCVDDALGAANDNTDYIFSKTVGDKQSFQMTDMTAEPNTVHGLQLRTRTARPTTGLRGYSAYLRSGAVESAGPEIGVASSYSWRRNGFITTDPDTGLAWEAAVGINGVRMGVEVKS